MCVFVASVTHGPRISWRPLGISARPANYKSRILLLLPLVSFVPLACQVDEMVLITLLSGVLLLSQGMALPTLEQRTNS